MFMRETSFTNGLMLLYLILCLSVPTIVALTMLSDSRMTAIKGDEPNYLSHTVPKKKTADVERQLNFDLGEIHKGKSIIPRNFLSYLPKSLPMETQVRRKKDLFVKTMLPLILRANELILEDREKLIAIDQNMEQGKPLSPRARRWVTPLLKRYRIPLKAGQITHLHIEKLLDRMDIIPPSLALAQAAIESGWGSSYFAQNYQAIFGQWTWNPEDKGVIPKRRPEGMTHRIRAFDYLLDSILAYMINLNRHPAYQKLRDRRTELKKHKLPITGHALAPALDKYSEKGEKYVSDLLNIMTYNKFSKYDFAELAIQKHTRTAENTAQ